MQMDLNLNNGWKQIEINVCIHNSVVKLEKIEKMVAAKEIGES